MLPVGRVNKLFGQGGELFVSLYDAFPDDMDLGEPIFVVIDSLSVPLFIEHIEQRGRTGAVVRFADFDNARRAGELVGRELLLPAGEEQADDEFLPEELIGFTVTVDGHCGEVTDYYDSDVNPLFGITIDGTERLVPVVGEFIAAIDFEGRTMEMTLPQGLLEL